MTQLMNDEAVCRTAPATPGLLIIVETKEKKLKKNVNIVPTFSIISLCEGLTYI